MLFILLGTGLEAQSTYANRVRDFVREKLVFYYIDDPTQPRPSNMGPLEIDKNAIAEGRDISSPVWTNAANRGFRQLLVDLLRPTDNGGDFRLQRITRDALLLTNKEVIVYLYNDTANAVPHPDWEDHLKESIYCQYDENDNTKNQCWPCASRFRDRSTTAGGHMALGAFYFDPAGNTTIEDAREKSATFLHELVHTQVQMVKESSVAWANWYGADGSGHYGFEILPSKNTAFNEGVATSFAFRYQQTTHENAISWFNTNKRMWVDSIPGCGTGGTPSYRCIIDRLAAAGQVGVSGMLDSIPGRIYNIRNIPPDLLLHNETIIANMIYEYTRQYRNPLMLVRDLKRAQSGIAAITGDDFTFLPLYKEILRSSQQWQPLNTPEDQRPRGELFTMGITDFYLGYKMATRDTLENAFGFTWSNDMPNVDDYFNTQRATLHGLRHNNTTWAQIQLSTFAERLSIHQPRPPAAASRTGGNK